MDESSAVSSQLPSAGTTSVFPISLIRSQMHFLLLHADVSATRVAASRMRPNELRRFMGAAFLRETTNARVLPQRPQGKGPCYHLRMSQARHLILVGLPGSGKSSVGRVVAQLLATDFTDLDDWVEAEAGRSIPAIFERMGEAAFRQLERAAM